MEPPKIVPITDQTVVDRSSSRQFGPQMLSLPEGDALCTDAVSLTCLLASDPETNELFAMLVAVAAHDGMHFGSLHALSAAQARNFAASLYETANQIDGGMGVS